MIEKEAEEGEAGGDILRGWDWYWYWYSEGRRQGGRAVVAPRDLSGGNSETEIRNSGCKGRSVLVMDMGGKSFCQAGKAVFSVARGGGEGRCEASYL